ncbi:hypothetical protein MXD81_08745, partial [Microbacteriaceae bacterium K1510]|nr:hypothetical protein [Microbacteriaceae bacterium K1510]
MEVDQLRPLQFSQRKAEYIIDFARALVNETVELERLHQLSDEEVIAYLTPLRGIGRWTVECLLMFGMGRPDLLPAADIGLRNGIHLVYQLATNRMKMRFGASARAGLRGEVMCRSTSGKRCTRPEGESRFAKHSPKKRRSRCPSGQQERFFT